MPWRYGTSDALVADSAVVAREEKHKEAAEAEDEASGENAEKARGRGVRVDWLVALTIALILWDWAIWEVAQFLVKPTAVDSGRCDFADLPAANPFKDPATALASHC